MGQVDVSFGLLPLTCGFWACAQGQLFLGGLIWSLTFLKLQYFVIPLFVAGTLATVKEACLSAWNLSWFGDTILDHDNHHPGRYIACVAASSAIAK